MFTINSIYSPESISFQKDEAFKKDLIVLIEKYRTDRSVKERTEFEIDLAACIKERTNINYEVYIGDGPMSTEPPFVDKNNPMFEGYGFEEMTMSKRTLHDIRGAVSKSVSALLDPARGRVGGYLAELPPIRQHLNAAMIYDNIPTADRPNKIGYTSGELAAIILHEVGHSWAYFEMLVHLRTTNQILAGIVRELDGTTNAEKREIIIKEASGMLELDDIDARAVAGKKDMTVYMLFITSLARRNKSQVGGGYDINSFEALADQYATRQGAGRDMVTGLVKLTKGTIDGRSTAAYFYVEILKLTAATLGFAGVAVGMVGVGITMFALAASLIMVDSHNEWYDKTGQRFKRIRNQLVERLKEKDLIEKEAERIRGDIDVIDKIATTYKDHTQFIGLVFDYLIPTGIGKRKDIEFQQSLEEMASNRLFYLASKVKSL